MKPKKQILFLIIIGITSLIISSCCKSNKCKCQKEWGKPSDDCTKRHYGPYYLGSVKDYVYFKKGTWWVYENDLSHDEDSVFVYLSDTTFQEKKGYDQPWKTLSYSDIYVKMRSDRFKYTTQFLEPVYYPDVTDFHFVHDYYKETKYDLKSGGAPNCFTTSRSKDFGFYDSLGTLTVLGKVYTEVLVFESSFDEAIPATKFTRGFRGKSHYYWAKGYGIIKMTLNSGNFNDPGIDESWNLKKYNIVQ